MVNTPTGRFWVVNVEANGNRLYFGSGRQDFVKDHCLGYGNFLVFKYCGKSKFRTKIYDKTYSEKIIIKPANKTTNDHP